MRSLLETLAQGLVDQPSRVRVHEHAEEGVVRLELEVARADRGRVIGRGGRTIDALRTLLAAVAERSGTRCEVEVLD